MVLFAQPQDVLEVGESQWWPLKEWLDLSCWSYFKLNFHEAFVLRASPVGRGAGDARRGPF